MKSSLKNRTIFTRDNLEVMRGMADECVDLIYLDPPFNSNHDYSAAIGSQAAGAEFKDTWVLSDIKEAWHGVIADNHPGLYDLLTATQKIHGNSMKAYLIYMAVRIIEMKRILRGGGTIYLHCDPTASHYLKLMMDEIFGKGNFRNEITWERTRGRSDASHWGNTTDIILFYSKTDDYRWQNVYRQRQTGAEPTTGDLTGAGTRNGVSGEPWQGYDPTLFGRHWAVPRNSVFAKWIDENVIHGYLQMEHPHERLNALDEAGMVIWSDNGRPSVVRPAEASAGAKVNNLWNDITRATTKERTGYPTQKPLALLERIILASSNEGDVVLDPFCGCATTCVAAEKLDRQWIGIDISEKAAELVKKRIHEELGLLLLKPIHRLDTPQDRDGERFS